MVLCHLQIWMHCWKLFILLRLRRLPLALFHQQPRLLLLGSSLCQRPQVAAHHQQLYCHLLAHIWFRHNVLLVGLQQRVILLLLPLLTRRFVSITPREVLFVARLLCGQKALLKSHGLPKKLVLVLLPLVHLEVAPLLHLQR